MLKEIFIINKAGIGLFYQNFEVNGQKEKDMVSAFLKAIQDFSEEYMNQKLQEIHLGTNKVVLFSGDPVSFVIKVSSASSSNQLEARIKLLKDRFLQNYTPQIERNDTEISVFDPFEEEVRKVFNIKIKPKRKSSERLQEILGISIKKENLKKLIGLL